MSFVTNKDLQAYILAEYSSSYYTTFLRVVVVY